VAAEYDLARPDYPAGVYDALGPLAGALVLDRAFPTGAMIVPYETWLWIGHKR